MSPLSTLPVDALPLAEAIRKFVPKKHWTAYEQATRDYDPLLTVRLISAEASATINKGERGLDPAADQARSHRTKWKLAWQLIEQAFVEQLVAGTLQLYVQADPPFGPWKVLASESCRDIRISLGTGRVTGPNFELTGVYVGKAQLPAAESIPTRSGAQGRPSSMYLIVQEFARRVEAGEIEPTLTKQAEDLASWRKRNLPEAPSCTAKTIRNRIRNQYREAKALTPSKRPKL